MNDVDCLTNIKKWLATQFQREDLENAQCVFRIQNIFESQEQNTSHVSSILYRQNIF